MIIENIKLIHCITGEIKVFKTLNNLKKELPEYDDILKEFNTKHSFEDEKMFLLDFRNNWNRYKNNDWLIVSIEENDEIKSQKNGKPKTAGNGESVPYFSQTLDKWVYQYWYNGKRKTLTQRKNERKTDFFKRVTEVKSKIFTDTYIERKKDTLYEIMEKHINQKFKDNVISASSYKREKDNLSAIEKNCPFVHKQIQKITLDDIQESKEFMKKYAQETINKMWRLLYKGFAIASSKSVNLIPYNIMADENLKKPISNNATKKVKPLSIKEREHLAYILDNEERNHKYRNIVKLEWLTSMRIGEVLARSKNDIDKLENTLHIHNTLTEDENGNIILGEHTKTYNKATGIDDGERYFPITDDIEEILEEELNKKITNIHGLLFWNYKDNKFIHDKEVNAWLRRINQKYHICKGSLHNHRLRHDRITQWKENNMDMRAIQYLAGHVEGSEVTDNVYISISPEYAFKEYQKTC